MYRKYDKTVIKQCALDAKFFIIIQVYILYIQQFLIKLGIQILVHLFL